MRRLIAVSSVLAVALVAASACGTATGQPNAPLTPSKTTPGATTPAATTRAPATTAKGPTTFPLAAQAYAQQVLTAWGQLQSQTLGDLTSPEAKAQILSISSPPGQQWTFQRCDGAAGSTYCSFASNEGDVITLRITNQLLGAAHATTEAKYDPTVYATDAKEYVRAFIEGWRNGNTRRMLSLASQTEVDYFTHYTPPETYTVCGLMSGALWDVRIYNGIGLNYLVKVTDAALGNKHAIASHLEPPVGPPVCS